MENCNEKLLSPAKMLPFTAPPCSPVGGWEVVRMHCVASLTYLEHPISVPKVKEKAMGSKLCFPQILHGEQIRFQKGNNGERGGREKEREICSQQATETSRQK